MIRRTGRLSLLAAAVAGGAIAVLGAGNGCGFDGRSSGGFLDANASADGPAANPEDGAPGDGASNDSRADTEAPGPLSPTYVDYDINHILETGQSNSVANGGRPVNTATAGTAFTNTQPYTNLMFDTGVMTSHDCDGEGCPAINYVEPASFLPLIESDGFFGGDRVETASSSMADQISLLALTKLEFGKRAGYPKKHDVLVSLHGRSGNTYWCLRKGGCNYKPASELRAFDEAVKQVQAGKALVMTAGKTYAVRAVTTVHGESDHYSYADNNDNHPELPLDGTNGVPNRIQEYDDALIEWQEDYQSMAKGITGQTQPVPLFVSGISGWTGARSSKLAALQLNAHVRAPGKVIYVAPGYIFDAGIQAGGALECLHYSLLGQQQLGEYFAKAYAQVVLTGKPWEPVRPLSITRAANVITVKYIVPVPPLTVDTTRVAAIDNIGFDFLDEGVLATITSVAISGPDTVTITLAATPSAGTKRLRYALNEPVPGCIGPGVLTAGGARGNLRDSDPTPSRLGFSLYNWGATFDMPVP